MNFPLTFPILAGSCALSPTAFMRELAAANPSFRTLAQQDAQEFVRLLLDKYALFLFSFSLSLLHACVS